MPHARRGNGPNGPSRTFPRAEIHSLGRGRKLLEKALSYSLNFPKSLYVPLEKCFGHNFSVLDPILMI